MAITIPFIFLVLYFIQDIYLKTSRQLRFMDLEAKSPLYSHFLETLDGLTTIRAFGWANSSRETNLKNLDVSQRPYYMLYCVQRWLELVMDLIVAGLAVTVVALAISLRSSSSGGLLGVALNNVLNFNQTLSTLIVQWTSLETSLGAIARIRTFAATRASEHKNGEDFNPPIEWPQRGALEFKNVSASYDDSSLALDNVSFSVLPGQKIGICGRTGSGKSTLLMTLLRLLDISSGSITIDSLDLSTMPRTTIRSRLIAIPQDPFLLSGSVRLNADPSTGIADTEIIAALQKVRLWDVIEARGGLDAEMLEQPLSQGQQQLFCLGRAILRRGQVLVLDEATSNVDAETDQLMQRVVREEFGGRTIIVVAHRLDTIMDSDMIAVLDKGKVVEYDTPANLLARESMFRQLYGS
jgi:ATP-binding cassette subfamily C (CFTR/MRP) protein 1